MFAILAGSVVVASADGRSEALAVADALTASTGRLHLIAHPLWAVDSVPSHPANDCETS